LTHTPPHSVPVPQPGTHTLAAQLIPAVHTCPHEPQLLVSDVVSTHAVPHIVIVPGQPPVSPVPVSVGPVSPVPVSPPPESATSIVGVSIVGTSRAPSTGASPIVRVSPPPVSTLWASPGAASCPELPPPHAMKMDETNTMNARR
jgi:hypothetical protein